MKRIILIGLFGAGIFSFAGCRSKESEGSYSERRAAWAVEKISDELKLNEGQKATANRIKDGILSKQEEFKSLYSGVVDEVLAQVKNEKVDEEALNKSFQDREQKLKEIRSFLVSKFGEFHSSLTPE